MTDAGLIQDDAGLTHLPVEVVVDRDGWEHVEIGFFAADGLGYLESACRNAPGQQ